MMRTTLSTVLAEAGMTILVEVADSCDALQVASRLSPGLILFSVNEPSLKDMERLMVLRMEISSAYIVALITGEYPEQYQSALDCGAHAVFTKTASHLELLKSIERLVPTRFYPVSMKKNTESIEI